MFDSKSASHETFVIAKFIFRSSHEFVVSAGSNCRYSFKIPLSHLFPRIISRYSTCHGRNFEALFAVKCYLILASTSQLNWRFWRCAKMTISVPGLSQPCRLTFKAHTTASYMYTGILRHVSIATQRAVLQRLYTIDNKTVDYQGCFH